MGTTRPARHFLPALVLVTVAGCGFNEDDPWLDGPVVTLETAPPPIHGGTLLVTADGARAIVADADRDRIVVVDLASGAVRELALDAGLELGRLVEDGSGRIHVVARRGGVLLEIDPSTATEVARRAPCAAPRGVAWDAAGDRLHVACADGALVTLGPTREIERVVRVAPDLRDVAVTAEGLLLTRFRSAETLLVRTEGALEPAHVLPTATLASPASPELSQSYAPGVAVRLVSGTAGIVLLHQRARIGPESVTRRTTSGGGSSYSYSSRPTTDGVVTWADPCDNAVAHVAVTSLRADGTATNVAMPVRAGVTPVDVALSGTGRVALALAGDPGGRFGVGPQIVLSDVERVSRPAGPMDCLASEEVGRLPGQVVAVAFAGDRWLALTREPATLVMEGREPIALGGEPVFDTGHALFHLDLGGTIACASCHPGGGDDGHVWEFMATGPIRTLSVEGVVGRAPYHRAGDVASFAALLAALEAQMDAAPLAGPRTEAIESWLAAVPLPPVALSSAPELAPAGEAIFEREGCADCHDGALGSDRAIHRVDTGSFVTAPLAGLAARAPYLHDGSAATLADVLAVHAGPIDATDHASLVAYLETR